MLKNIVIEVGPKIFDCLKATLQHNGGSVVIDFFILFVTQS